MKSIFSILIFCFSFSAYSKLPDCIGEDTSNWDNCFGTQNWDITYNPDGSINDIGEQYSGEWKNGKPHGYGIYKLSERSMHGSGTYEGEFENGKFHGFGKTTTLSGEIYKQGIWENGQLVTETDNYESNVNKNTESEATNRLSDTCLNSEWLYYGSTDSWEYCVNTKRIKKNGDSVFVWTRARYNEITQYGHGSHQAYQKINCKEFKIQVLAVTFYADMKWRQPKVSQQDPLKETFIYPNSVDENLAKFVCKQ